MDWLSFWVMEFGLIYICFSKPWSLILGSRINYLFFPLKRELCFLHWQRQESWPLFYPTTFGTNATALKKEASIMGTKTQHLQEAWRERTQNINFAPEWQPAAKLSSSPVGSTLSWGIFTLSILSETQCLHPCELWTWGFLAEGSWESSSLLQELLVLQVHSACARDKPGETAPLIPSISHNQGLPYIV